MKKKYRALENVIILGKIINKGETVELTQKQFDNVAEGLLEEVKEEPKNPPAQ